MRRGWRRREGEGGSEFVMSGAEAADDVNFTLSLEHVRFFVHTLADIVHFVYTYAYTNSNIYIRIRTRIPSTSASTVRARDHDMDMPLVETDALVCVAAYIGRLGNIVNGGT